MTALIPTDYQIHPRGDPPPGYPAAPQPDTFQTEPDGLTYEERRAQFIAHVLKNPAPLNTKPVWYELVRQVGGGVPHEGVIWAALDFINARRDCSDFVLHSILRMMYQFAERHPVADRRRLPQAAGYSFSPELVRTARRTILDFKYFPDEPGDDSMCTWTENHYILFASAAYLAGQLYPDEVFTNSGETGREKMTRNRPRILRWLDLRFRTGFSEWLSHVYYDEDLTALLSLYDFAEDEEIRARAEAVIGLLLLDMALNSWRGIFSSTNGRAYEHTKKWAACAGTTDTAKLLFGMGIYSSFDNMSAPAFALSGYRPPPAIVAIAQDVSATCENRQRMGIRLDELEAWGLRPDNFEDGMHCLTLEAYFHPRTARNTLRMFDTCRWWKNDFFRSVQPYRTLLRTLDAVGGLPLLARVLERDICRNTREEVNIYTYRTPDYMLSTAQDYRKGYGGDQQHIWQATLGPDAVCFTTHPARLEGRTPDYWAGSGLLPRAAQYRNVAIIIYKLERIPALYVPIRHFYTHAWLPRDRFDEVVEAAGWVFARKGEGYLALRSQHPYFWNEGRPAAGLAIRLTEEERGREMIVPGRRNIWVCQLGRRAEDGDFATFIRTLLSAQLIFEDLRVTFQSPGNGRIQFGWEGPLTVDGVPVPLYGYPRYENPYVQAPFPASQVTICAAGHRLNLELSPPS